MKKKSASSENHPSCISVGLYTQRILKKVLFLQFIHIAGYAENLHRKTDEVLISHCAEQVEMPPPTLMEPKDTLNEQLARTREEKNKATHQSLQELANKFQINHKIQQLQGHPGLAIVKAAEENNAGMVICGSRGMGFIRRTIIGSVSDYILHHARMPVIICKNEEEQEKLKNWYLF